MTTDNIIPQSTIKSRGNGLKVSIKNILLNHKGQDRAITGNDLARIFNFTNDRSIRIAIRELISEGYPIASSTENPPGYFIIVSRKQAEQYANSIKNRLIEDANRRRDFRKAADKWLTPAIQERLI